MKTIFDYLDYQKYLLDFYEFRKQKDSYFSYRYMGQKCRLDPGFLVKVLQGKMHLSLKSIQGVAEFVGLNEKESSYFDLLVRYGRGSTPAEIKRYFKKLASFHESPAHELHASRYEFYRKWYYSAVWAFIKICPFNGDFKKLAGVFTPRLTIKQAKESIALLQKLEMIVDDGSGRYVQKQPFITSGEKWQSGAVADFQKETLDLAAHSLQDHPKDIRDISTVTLAVSAEDFEEIRHRAAEFRKSLFSIKSGKPADTIYQVNMQIFPMTNPPKGGRA